MIWIAPLQNSLAQLLLSLFNISLFSRERLGMLWTSSWTCHVRCGSRPLASHQFFYTVAIGVPWEIGNSGSRISLSIEVLHLGLALIKHFLGRETVASIWQFALGSFGLPCFLNDRRGVRESNFRTFVNFESKVRSFLLSVGVKVVIWKFESTHSSAFPRNWMQENILIV